MQTTLLTRSGLSRGQVQRWGCVCVLLVLSSPFPSKKQIRKKKKKEKSLEMGEERTQPVITTETTSTWTLWPITNR